jgi:hypothetical protein
MESTLSETLHRDCGRQLPNGSSQRNLAIYRGSGCVSTLLKRGSGGSLWRSLLLSPLLFLRLSATSRGVAPCSIPSPLSTEIAPPSSSHCRYSPALSAPAAARCYVPRSQSRHRKSRGALARSLRERNSGPVSRTAPGHRATCCPWGAARAERRGGSGTSPGRGLRDRTGTCEVR